MEFTKNEQKILSTKHDARQKWILGDRHFYDHIFDSYGSSSDKQYK